MSRHRRIDHNQTRSSSPIIGSIAFLILAHFIAPASSSEDVNYKAAQVLPTNDNIPSEDLVQLSLQVIPTIAEKLKFPAPIKTPTDVVLSQQCEESLDWHNNKARRVNCHQAFCIMNYSCSLLHPLISCSSVQGCYASIYVCDNEFSGRCFWSFRRQCECPKFWIFKFYECRIAPFEVPLPPGGKYETVDVPIGECVPAVWLWVLLIAAAIPLVWYILFRGVRIAHRKLY